jgi:phospholipid/cholesterol/gamma-HCH transport system substrate-binding protein
MAREPGKAGGRLSRRAARATENLDQHKTLLGLIVIAVGVFLAFVAFISTTGPPFQPKYELEVHVPDGAPVLREGQAVRIGGKLAGLISEVSPDRENGGATVTANITKTEFRPLPADTEAYVRVHSIVYETYLELRPGGSEEELTSGDEVTTQATSGVDLLEVVQLFDEQTRESLRETVVSVGYGLAGRGVEANEALEGIAPLSRDLRAQLDAATSQPRALERLVAGAAGTASGLRGTRPDDVGALIRSSDATFATVAARAEDLRRTIELLPGFEDQLIRVSPLAETLLDDVAALAPELQPAVTALNEQLPDLNRLLSLGDTLGAEVDRIADVADPVLAAAGPVVVGLFPTMTSLGPLNADLADLQAFVKPYRDEFPKAGRWFSDATSHDYEEGMRPGAPAGRVAPVLTPFPCSNAIPDPDEALKDRCHE